MTRIVLDTNVLVAAAYADKFLAAAVAGRAGWIVTNDGHLLAHDPCGDVPITAEFHRGPLH